jgi:hypothetical protein
MFLQNFFTLKQYSVIRRLTTFLVCFRGYLRSRAVHQFQHTQEFVMKKCISSVLHRQLGVEDGLPLQTSQRVAKSVKVKMHTMLKSKKGVLYRCSICRYVIICCWAHIMIWHKLYYIWLQLCCCSLFIWCSEWERPRNTANGGIDRGNRTTISLIW